MSEGDYILIKGKSEALAKVARAADEDAGLDIIRMDSAIRNNAGVGLGDQVEISSVEVKEAKAYAKKYGLETDDTYLYAYRNHDMHGRGMWDINKSYKKGTYYKDWRCDLDRTDSRSFGLGIYPIGNTKVRVKLEDWGTEVLGLVNFATDIGKVRVWGFEII